MKTKASLLFIMLISAVSIFGQNGQDGNVTWEITDSTLLITGTGEMKDYDYNSNKAPWYLHRAIIKNVVISDGLTSIGQSAFALCSILENIKVGSGITSIGNNSFLGCRNLSAINIPNGLESIGALAFGACSSLSGIIIPDKVVIIGEGAFSGCSGLKSINIDNKNNIYKDISGIVYSKDETELLIYPAGIEDETFTVPDFVSNICYGAFINCSNLKNIEISEGVVSIGREAFYNCDKLETIKIPRSVTTMGENTFQYCRSISTIEVNREYPISVSSGIFLASSFDKAKLIVPAGAKNAYEKANVWKDFGSIIELETTNNLQINHGKVNVAVANGILSVDSPYVENVNIFSSLGSLVSSFTKNEGRATYTLPNMRDGIYFIAGAKGWSAKIRFIP